ncbi:MAG: ABC transporter permease subunit [Actinomycetota bacterium]
MTRLLRGLVTVVGALVAWQLLATIVDSTVYPTPTDILGSVELDTIVEPVAQTVRLALVGFVIGVTVSMAIGLLCVLVPRFEPIGLQLALLTYTVPVLALGSVLATIWSATATRITIAALFTVYTTVIGTVVGLRSADRHSVELVTAFGASRLGRARLIELPAAVPSLLAALKIALPASLLGTIIGEYIGGDGGVGVAMLSSQRLGNVERVWALAIAISVVAGAGYLAIAAVERMVDRRRPSVGIPSRSSRPELTLSAPRRLARGVLQGLAIVGVVLGLWYGALWYFDVNAFVGITPDRVWEHLVTGDDAAANRDLLFGELSTTFGHAAFGFVVGTGAGVVGAIAMRLAPWAERMILPLAVTAQSVPIVALLPLALLLLGRGNLLVGVVAGLVSFFPTLVNVDASLARTPTAAVDLVAANGASSWRNMVLTRLPYAAPALFASARIAIPASVAGALLVEWQVLGNGIGRVMVNSALQSRYVTLWSAVVVISVATTLVALIALAGERIVSRRFGLDSSLS